MSQFLLDRVVLLKPFKVYNN